MSLSLPWIPAVAQSVGVEDLEVSEDAEMLLEADTLVFDNDNDTVTAVGGVQIDYDGNRLVAQRVTYDRSTQRLIASGGVDIVFADGNRVQAERIDITDDFRDGFVRALRVETPNKTYFAADTARRRGGSVTTFNYGVYTACEPCEEEPDKAPVWRIKARKVIWNGETKTVRFQDARFEFFGFPLAYLPIFEIADPTVERKTGFLMPSYSHDEDLGHSVQVPFYFALSPAYDLTVSATGFSKQGVLGQAEWRQRFNSGQYSIRIAAIQQLDPEEFVRNNPRIGEDIVDNVEFRGMVGTKGRFEINPRWTFGWDILAQTDKNFAYTYSLGGYSDYVHRSEIYLTGLNDRNFFDLRAYRFQVQEARPDSSVAARAPLQPWVLPSFDYSRAADEPVFGGLLTFDVNAQGITRERLDDDDFDGDGEADIVRGIDGASGRITAETEWKRTLITPAGLAITPLLHARGDVIGVDFQPRDVAAIEAMAGAGPDDLGVGTDIQSQYFRGMATAGLEARWPFLFAAGGTTHILEPTAQLFARPDAPYQDTLGIPNEDAQSMVFDATTLFERDKFSGYDRIEGGVRANVGFRYSGDFGNGWSSSAIVGQSFHLAGDNPFDAPDLVNAGAYSGLETDVSDYVGQVGLLTPVGLALTAGGRFDEESFEMRRADLAASYSNRPLSLIARYSFIQAQTKVPQGETPPPDQYGFENDRHEVSVSGSLRIHDNWRIFGSGTYDIENEFVARRSIGFAYDDECFGYAFYVKEKLAAKDGEVDRTFGFSVSLRTLGEIGSTSGAFSN